MKFRPSEPELDGLLPDAERDPDTKPVALRAADSADGTWVGCASPRLSWSLEATRGGVRQEGYELETASDAEFSRDVESSGLVRSSSPFGAAWPASPLRSRDRRYVRVRVWTDRGRTDWSSPRLIEAALLEAGDWEARPISPASNVGRHDPAPAALVRRCFELKRPVARARLYVSALGVHDTWINGERVGDAVLDPGWTAYQKRLLYAAYDVTSHLRPGDNVLAGAVGDGWWRGNLTWEPKRCVYGDTTALLAQLEIIFEDGSQFVVATDESWRGGAGAIRSADIYDGSTCDLGLEPADWRLPNFDDRHWEGVERLPLPCGLELRAAPPVRVVDSWPLDLRPTSRGTLMADCGQNLAGYVKLRVRGPSGGEIVVRHAEVLTPEGELFTAALRHAKATDRYVLAGDGTTADLEPAFTFHGFRYAEFTLDPGVVIESAEVCVLSSDLEQTGTFACSDPNINKLFSNVVWSQRGNFLSIPTDCPQRDERMGWTGDIQVFAPTACANADARTFLASWLKDLALEQRADGAVAVTVPNVVADHPIAFGAAGWGDAATLTPWALYEAYGDAKVLSDQFESMRSWVDWCASRRNAEGVWAGDFQFGDWLDPGAPPDRPDQATTKSGYVATAYMAYSAGVLARAAAVIGRQEAAVVYQALSEELRAAAWTRWGDHALTTQAGCAIAIMFGVAPPEHRDLVVEKLAALVESGGGRIATGFLGTPLVLPALTRCGRLDAAYKLLLNEACPGWLYQVKAGATTTWERWDGLLPDGSINRGDMAFGDGSAMTSFNHYAYGAVAEWLYRTVAGIAPDATDPGYGLVVFAPRPGGGLRHARASCQTPYGRSAIDWRLGEDQKLEVRLEIAAGARGRFEPPPGWRMPGGADGPLELGSGRHELLLSAPAG